MRIVLFVFYAYRSLLVRIRANVLTMLAVALLVIGGSMALSFYASLRGMLLDTTPPENVIVLSKGAAGEGDSKVSLDTAHRVVLFDGVKRNGNTPVAVRELVTRVYLNDSGTDDPVPIRGIDEQSLQVHRVTIAQGAAPASGTLEIAIGRRVHEKYPKLAIGQDISLPGGPCKITGILNASGGPMEDEIWTPRSALEAHLNVKYSSSVTLVATDKDHVDALVDKLNHSPEVEAQAIQVSKLLETTADLSRIATVVLVLIILLSIVATFAIATTMNAAAAVRMPEFAALAAIGIHRSILGRIVLLESILLATVGAIIGVVASAVMRMEIGAISLGMNPVELTGNASIAVAGLVLGLLVAIVGGSFAAVKVARLNILEAMR